MSSKEKSEIKENDRRWRSVRDIYGDLNLIKNENDYSVENW